MLSTSIEMITLQCIHISNTIRYGILETNIIFCKLCLNENFKNEVIKNFKERQFAIQKEVTKSSQIL